MVQGVRPALRVALQAWPHTRPAPALALPQSMRSARCSGVVGQQDPRASRGTAGVVLDEGEGSTMPHHELSDLLVHDAWDALPEQLREEFVTRRAASTGWGVNRRQDQDSRCWEPLRPVVIDERAYRGLESLTARLLRLAVDACRRRAPTLGELYRVLGFSHPLPLIDPDRPLVAAELTRYARPDLLIENGRPRLLEFNNSTRLGGTVVTPQLAEAYARLCPQSGLHPPPSTVTARAA